MVVVGGSLSELFDSVVMHASPFRLQSAWRRLMVQHGRCAILSCRPVASPSSCHSRRGVFVMLWGMVVSGLINGLREHGR